MQQLSICVCCGVVCMMYNVFPQMCIIITEFDDKVMLRDCVVNVAQSGVVFFCFIISFNRCIVNDDVNIRVSIQGYRHNSIIVRYNFSNGTFKFVAHQ